MVAYITLDLFTTVAIPFQPIVQSLGSVICNRETRPYFEREDDQPGKAINLNMHDVFQIEFILATWFN
jgi:hypothetical protein